FAPAFAVFQAGEPFRIARFQGKNIGGGLDQSLVEKRFDLLVAKAVYIERVAADEMLEALHRLRGAGEAPGAALHHFALLPRRVAAADGAEVGEMIGR